MDRMDFIMKNKECVNCGSTKFHPVENGWKCDYCGTLYLNQEKKTVKKQQNTQSIIPKKRSRLIIGIVLASLFILVGPIGALVFKTTSTSSYEPIEQGKTASSDKKDYPGEWNQSIYSGIKVATQHYDQDTEKYSFEGGADYKELEKLVGPPDRVTTWEKNDYGMPPRSEATWNKTKDGDYAGATVSITYEKNTLRITDKRHY